MWQDAGHSLAALERLRVAGSELSEVAVKQLFSELAIEPKITAIDDIRRHSADNIDIFVGDIFDLSRGVLGRVDAIYDRAALVALPETMRGSMRGPPDRDH